MQIGIDATFLARDRRGMGRVARSVIEKFIEFFDHEFYLIMVKHRSDEGIISQFFKGGKFQFINPKDPRMKLLDVVWYPWNRIDILPNCRRVVTIHDLAPFRFFTSRKGSVGYNDRKRIKTAAEASDKIITPSEFTKNEICTFLEVPPEKIEVIHHGVDDNFCQIEYDRDRAAALLDKFSNGLPYILYVGNVEKRKNVETLIDAFGKAKKSYTFPHKLVIAGKLPPALLKGYGASGWTRVLSSIGIPRKQKKNHLLALTEKLAIKDEVIWLGEVNDQELVALYNMAKLFVFPSYYEGFGLPILEALSCGVPSIASSIPSFEEVAGESVLYFDPKNPSDLAEKIWLVISDSLLSNRMRKLGSERASQFKWDNSAHKHMKILEEL